MGYRPNFTGVELRGSTVHVHGLSAPGDPEFLADIVDIRVVLVQGRRLARATADQLRSDWVARVPVADPAGAGPDFHLGDAVAYGVETHEVNAMTITWIEGVTIEAVEPVPE